VGRIIRRVKQAGVYFVTTDTWQKRALFAKAATAQVVLEQLLSCRDRGFYKLHAFVVMPDHLHVLLTPEGTITLEKAMQMIKGGSAYRIRKEQHLAFPVWHEGFHDRRIRNASEYHNCRNYIERNPVEAKLVGTAEEYAFSSASGRYGLESSKFDGTSGAKAPASGPANVAAEAATHNPAHETEPASGQPQAVENEVRKSAIYQVSWLTLPGLRGLACSAFHATETAMPDNERGVALEFGNQQECDAFLAEVEAHFATQRFSNNAGAFEAVKTYILERAAQRQD
jgi:putative transposase